MDNNHSTKNLFYAAPTSAPLDLDNDVKWTVYRRCYKPGISEQRLTSTGANAYMDPDPDFLRSNIIFERMEEFILTKPTSDQKLIGMMGSNETVRVMAPEFNCSPATISRHQKQMRIHLKQVRDQLETEIM